MTVPTAGKYFRWWGLLFCMLAIGADQANAQTCPRTERQYAVSSTITGSVTSQGNATDGLPATASTLSIVAVLPASQFLNFGQRQSSTTTAYVKLSGLAGLLGLVGNVSVQGFIMNGSTPQTVGTATNVQATLGLISASGSTEIAVTPGVAFDGIVVRATGVGLGFSMQVYDAWILRTATGSIDCNGVRDFYSGARAGISALNSGSGVTNPANAVDNDPAYATFAHMEMPVGVANTVYEMVIFNTPSVAGDSIRVVLANGGSQPLDLTALGSFSIQPYLGSVAAGPPITNSTSLSLRLLAPGSLLSILTAPVNASFDRVELRLDAVAGLLLTMNIYDVARIAKRPAVSYTISGSPGADPICITRVGGIQLSVTSTEPCATFNWYRPEPTLIGSGSPFSPPAITVPGLYTYYVGAQRTGCSNVETKQSLSFTVVPKAGPPVLTIQPNP